MMRLGLMYQGGAILLMLFQSYFSAVYLGLDSFGAQMLAIAPVFFAQSVIEPPLQAEANAGASDRRVRLNVHFISVVIGIGILVWLSGMFYIGQTVSLPMATLVLVYFAYTALTSIQFALGSVNVAAITSMVLLAFYVAGFFLSDIAYGADQIIFGNILGFLAGALVSGSALFRARSVEVYQGPVRLDWLAAGLTFRLPLVVLTGVSTMILGRIGTSTAVIGEFRVFMSALNAGKYLNPVPLAQAQQVIHRWSRCELDNLARRILISYVAGLAAFTMALIILFPPIFIVFFGNSNFRIFDLLLATSILILQPVSYAYMTLRTGRGDRSPIIFIACSLMIVAVFYLSNAYDYGPFFGVGVSATLVVGFLILQLKLCVRKNA